VLEALYSSAFQGAHIYLRWTLLGDYFKVSSWILSAPMLAAADMKLFLASDLTAIAAFVGAAVMLNRWHEPAESAAMAFVVMYVVHLAVSVLYVCRRLRLRLGKSAASIWLAGLALVLGASFCGWKGAHA
jgi:PST family polysaccharide transporter